MQSPGSPLGCRGYQSKWIPRSLVNDAARNPYFSKTFSLNFHPFIFLVIRWKYHTRKCWNWQDRNLQIWHRRRLRN